ncbi:30S ribosomal protein S9 [Candidatus Gracilibacteria bacterium CG17_big_fil_post_rev_8_21_14_2_50_48_13]|nr:MAG: 30S ribosomal protein S9 [Candidatus Gracilibacteria bacterium CG17_big_fil_post_rev_8_21_14_2_50_48_13]
MDFTGRKYIYSYSRRKTTTAQVRLYEGGNGTIIINGRAMKDYVTDPYLIDVVTFPLKLIEKLKTFDISILVKGGGKSGQADACRTGIARALLKLNEEFKPILRQEGLLSIDSRIVERKKPGKRKARRSPQWAKR